MQHYTRAVSIVTIILFLIAGGAIGWVWLQTKNEQTTNNANLANPTVNENTNTTTNGNTNSDTVSYNVYLVQLNDNGAHGTVVGCGDSLVAVQQTVPFTSGVLRVTLTDLFARTATNDPSGYYNAVANSRLTITSAEVLNGKATVVLAGTTQLGGVCDDPRFVEQIKQTVLQFSTVTSAEITINGQTLESFGSER